MASQALASLTATYTDSEGEENVEEEEQSELIAEIQSGSSSAPSTPPKNPKPNTKPRTKTRLVSYHDDTIASDDDDEENESEEEPEEPSEEAANVEDVPDDSVIDKKYEHLGVKLPPEPAGKCPQDLQNKINKLYDKMIQEKLDMNKVIQERKDFRNPSIYEKLIQYCGINEFGTNYPPEKYDPFRFGKESYYEELSKVQKVEMDKREKERRERNKIDFAAAQAKRQEEKEAKKRNSKWDQQGPNGTVIPTIKPAGLVQPTLTKNVTGSKSTVISAFGILPSKKPRI